MVPSEPALGTVAPTVELHRHFEAGLTPETIAHLAQKNGITGVTTRNGAPVEGVDPQDPASIRAYYVRIAEGFTGEGGFPRFLDSFGLPLSVLCSLEDLERAAFDQIVELASQGSLHSELRGSPFSYAERIDAPLVEILEALRTGVERAWNERGASGTFIAAFSRQKALGPESGPESARQAPAVVKAVVSLCTEARPIGIDIAGFPELDYPPRMFEAAMAPAREAGVPITIHCGEQGRPPAFAEAPAELVIEAIEKLGARRIGHGTCVATSPQAQALMIERGVGVECCPASNLLMGFIDRLEDHPLANFVERGLLASIATDDPLMFGDFTVRALIDRCGEGLGLDPEAEWKLAENGVASAFVSAERRAALSSVLRALRTR